MKSAGLQPTTVTYGILLNGYCKIGRIAAGLSLFKEMSLSGVKPITIMYNIILDGLFCSGRTVCAKEKFHTMNESGIPVGVDTYNIVLSGLCKNNCTDEAIELRIEEAKDLFATISAIGLVPFVVTYSVMMTNFIKEGLLADADDMFLAMENAGCAPNSSLLNQVVRALLEKCAVVKAATYLAKLDAKQLSVEASTISLIVSIFSGEGKLREHVKLLPMKYQPPEMFV
ncbi:hypothetical protein CFC21_019761 [Triticum aestivum]|uniref:Pentacotripeptide-repeat region of PRORP domain-containing protein n=2 Tax=Triticum aestivum TaxID=4565 RepID=A0A3B6B7V9_WHEAT|nr:hypothetical protein CFC21_019761 [Triticum aestivum]